MTEASSTGNKKGRRQAVLTLTGLAVAAAAPGRVAAAVQRAASSESGTITRTEGETDSISRNSAPNSAHIDTHRGAHRGANRGADPWQRWAGGQWRGFTTDNIPKLGHAALDALRATGAGLARVGLRIDPGCSTCGPSGVASHNLQSLQSVLAHAQRAGLGVVVLGDFEAGADTAPLWSQPALQNRFVHTWAALARELGNHPAVAGLDLLNEPNPPMADGTLASAQALWRNLAQRTVAEIRRTGCDRPIVFESVAGGSALGLRGLQPLDDPRVVYSLHFYTPHDITHQQVSAHWPRRIPYPAGTEWQLGGWDAELGVGPIDAARLAAELRFARQFQRLHARPLYVGEFGCARWAPQGSASRWISDCVNLFNTYGWSWSFHSFRTWPGWDAEIDSEDPQARVRTDDAPLMQLLRRALRRAETAAVAPR